MSRVTSEEIASSLSSNSILSIIFMSTIVVLIALKTKFRY